LDEGESFAYWDIADEGLEADENCKLGTGIIERLGGRGGWEDMGDVALDVENAGEKARGTVAVFSSSYQPASEVRPDIACDLEGAGMWLGVLGLGRGVGVGLA
jgi:hypothetical protein